MKPRDFTHPSIARLEGKQRIVLYWTHCPCFKNEKNSVIVDIFQWYSIKDKFEYCYKRKSWFRVGETTPLYDDFLKEVIDYLTIDE